MICDYICNTNKIELFFVSNFLHKKELHLIPTILHSLLLMFCIRSIARLNIVKKTFRPNFKSMNPNPYNVNSIRTLEIATFDVGALETEYENKDDYIAPFVLIETTPPFCKICHAPLTNMSCNLIIMPDGCPLNK